MALIGDVFNISWTNIQYTVTQASSLSKEQKH